MRSLPRKARDRPDRQVHRVVSGLHCSTLGDYPRVPPWPLLTVDPTPLPTVREELKSNPVATEPRLETMPTPQDSASLEGRGAWYSESGVWYGRRA